MSDERCDWCLRPLAPEEWESATTGEQRDGYCWGPGDALCDELHEAEWERMRSEVVRLREQVAEEHAAWAGVTEQWQYALAQLVEERATSARLRGLLRDMEYGHYPDGLASLCPACHLTPRMGHSVDCRLAAALKEET